MNSSLPVADSDTSTSDVVELFRAMQTELESIVVRGVQSVDTEEIRWLSDTRDRLGEMGAGFLSSMLDQFIEAVREDRRRAAPVLLRLLTVVRVFERVETLDAAAEALERMKENMQVQATDDSDAENLT